MLDKKRLNYEYWNIKYKTNYTGWDLGQISPPIKEYIDTVLD